MSLARLIRSSLLHYRWIHLSVVAGVALTAGILSGALVVGDSVKESLRRNADARVAQMGPVFLGGERFVTGDLATRVAAELGEGAIVAPILQTEGTAVNRAGGQRINRVQLVGVDESFWGLSPGGEAPEGFSDTRWVGINRALADRIGAGEGDTLVTRVELPGALSKDAPLSGDADQTTPFTVEISEVLDAEAFGLYSLRAEQVPPSTLFVRLERLQATLEQSGGVNVIAAHREVDAERFSEAVAGQWDLDDLQLVVRPVEGGPMEARAGEEEPPTAVESFEAEPGDLVQLTSGRVFFDSAVVGALGEVAEKISPTLTYLVNNIESGDRATPYSMVAGVGVALNEIVDEDLGEDEILLSDWLAEDLAAKVGDSVTLVYYVVGSGRALAEESRDFTVAGILPIGEKGWNRSWTPDFPGIFDVDDLDSWEPGIPIDRDRIRDKDDDYWDLYRTTPKAFVSLEGARSMWGNRFGDTTSVRFRGPTEPDVLADALRERVELSELGMAFRDLRAEAEEAVRHSFDFGSLFASMSFFLILAALTLAGLVFVFGIEQRASEIGLLMAVGFTRRRVRILFTMEAALLALAGAAIGLLLGYVYTRLALEGMSGVWRDAAAGIEFVYHLRPVTLVISFVATVVISLLVVWFSSRRISSVQPSRLVSGGDDVVVSRRGGRVRDAIVLGAGLLGGIGCLVAPKTPGTMAEQGLFFGAGFLFVFAGIALASMLIRRLLRPSTTLPSVDALGRQHTVRRRGRSLAVIGLMAAGVFMVTAINSFRLDGERGADRRSSGTGGFPWMGEATLPVYEDLNTEAGREKFGLESREEEFEFVSCRVSDGDDASCLNLNRAQRPRLLGAPVDLLTEKNPFSFTQAEAEIEGSPWQLLDSESAADARKGDGDIPVIPGILDQNTATYALKKGLGDLVVYETVSGNEFAVRIVGLLNTSVLQGSILISEENFTRFFPDAGGYQFFLLDGESVDALEPVATQLTRMLGDRGLEMRPTAEKLNEFNAVQNTYLSIFSTLGGLGILLGTVGLAIVVGRNVLERRGQLGVMQAMGFTRRQLARMVLSEHWFLHVAGVALGFGAALVAVYPQIAKSFAALPWGLLAGVNGGVLIGGLVFCALAARSVLRGNLMEAIRRE